MNAEQKLILGNLFILFIYFIYLMFICSYFSLSIKNICQNTSYCFKLKPQVKNKQFNASSYKLNAHYVFYNGS
jgi:hypothetical protein